MAASLLTQMEQEALALPESQLQEKNTQTETSAVRREDRLHFTINDFDPSSTDEPAQIRHRGDCEFAVQADAGKVFKDELIRVDQPQTLESELSFIAGRSSHAALTCAVGRSRGCHAHEG